MWFLEKVGGGGDFSRLGRREQELSRGAGPSSPASPALGPPALPGAGLLSPQPWPTFACTPLPPPRSTSLKPVRAFGVQGSFSVFRLKKTLERSRCHPRPHCLFCKEPKCRNELVAFIFLPIYFLTSGFLKPLCSAVFLV